MAALRGWVINNLTETATFLWKQNSKSVIMWWTVVATSTPFLKCDLMLTVAQSITVTMTMGFVTYCFGTLRFPLTINKSIVVYHMKKKLFVQYVSVDADNAGPWIDKLVSTRKITLARAARHYEKVHSFNWDSDGITFIGAPERVKI